MQQTQPDQTRPDQTPASQTQTIQTQTIHQPLQPDSSETERDHLETSRAILTLLFGPADARTFATRWWDGSLDAPILEPQFTLEFRRPGAVRRMLLQPSELSLAEAFICKDFEVIGDIEAAAALETQFRAGARTPLGLLRLLPLLLRLPTNDLPDGAKPTRPSASRNPQHSRTSDAEEVRSHYDKGNDFYGLWLDRRMIYSCAYFQTGTEDIDTAQAAKLEHICKKLRLKSGEHLLDIGCGWGGLVIHAAQRYGVRATGITLSEPQAEFARERVRELGLSDLVQIEVRDYRDFPPGTQFDKIVSVGMVEHVGRRNISRYFAEAARLLRPGGVFLCHGIVESLPPRPPLLDLLEGWTWRQRSFLQHYVFPGGEVLRVSDLLHAAQRAGFEVRDLENLREHYALTTRLWRIRLEARQNEVVRLVGEHAYRVYRLYLGAITRTFTGGRNGVAQMLLYKATVDKVSNDGSSHLPLTRADWYEYTPDARD
jgi:cyclopropane-fatty-acyl-phospholipid synthase